MKIKRKLMAAVRWAVWGILFLGGAAWAADDVRAAPAQVAASASLNDLVLKDDAKCTACHDEADAPELLAIGKTRHGVKADSRTPTCTSCHGASTAHVDRKGQVVRPKPDVVFGVFGKNSNVDPRVRNEPCLRCHQQDAKRSHWAGSTHQTRDVACTSCHQVHVARDKVLSKLTQPDVCFLCHKAQRTEISKPSRHPILEGKMSCSDCHNAHGSVGPKLMKRDSVVETCYPCHMEKRGPFVHNHQPVSEDCSICHNPHGTVTENMLKMRTPFLCHSCHTPHDSVIPTLRGSSVPDNTPRNSPAHSGGGTHSGSVGGTHTGKSAINFTQARGCLNCHTQVHGSNNPAATNPTPQYQFR